MAASEQWQAKMLPHRRLGAARRLLHGDCGGGNLRNVADDLGLLQPLTLAELAPLAFEIEAEMVLADLRDGAFDRADFELVALMQRDHLASGTNVQPDFALAIDVEQGR